MRSSMTGSAIAMLLVLILAVSCKDVEPKVTVVTTVSENSKLRREVSDLLRKAIADVSKSKEALAAETAATADAPANESVADAAELPAELHQLASFEWSGPAEDAAREIAAKIGYSFSVSGNPPSISPAVHIFLDSVPVATILEKIGLQVYPAGEIVVDLNRERIEFRFMQTATNKGKEK